MSGEPNPDEQDQRPAHSIETPEGYIGADGAFDVRLWCGDVTERLEMEAMVDEAVTSGRLVWDEETETLRLPEGSGG